ncbi:MAG TPA: Spy/CpxP family protein refolding chaperone [Gemmatimonadales bacterium]|nr:Spy/CpxP family protein refolding chaperone [Gemmatimonadales bacterium]
MGPPMGMGPEMMVFQPSHLINRRDLLNLTPDQVARLEALSQEAARTRTQADSIARLRHEQIRELWKAEAPDVAQIRSHAQAAMQAQQNAMLAGLEAAARAKALLSAEQRGRVGGWADRPGREPQMRMQMRPPMRGRRMMRGGGR